MAAKCFGNLMMIKAHGRLPCWRSFIDVAGGDVPVAFVTEEYNTLRADLAFRHFERGWDRAIGKQAFSGAQRDRIDHQPEHIDQVMFEQRLEQVSTSPN